MDKDKALELAKAAYKTSTSFIDEHYRREWEANERQFASRHPEGSKYESDDYKFRSKLFRPKTRSTVQSNEADAAFAFFGNNKLLDIKPNDDNSRYAKGSAIVLHNLLQYRLEHSVPWFKIVMGAFQDAAKHDICAAYTYWDYLEEEGEEVQYLNEYGELESEKTYNVIYDKPCVEVVPVENLRIDPSADWLDPVNSSPYLIHIIPMTVQKVMERMKTNDPKTGHSKWFPLEMSEIATATDETREAMQSEREGKFESSETKSRTPSEFDIVYVHRNFIRWDGKDWTFYTLGDQRLLTAPVPASEAYWHLRKGERPYIMGNIAIETHKVYPESGVCKLTRSLQRESNDLANLRMDNVKLGVTGRHLVKRTANVDYDMLRKNIPGSGILTDNPESDIVPLVVKDATAGSYNEQTRLDADFGDISGAFAPSQVATNRMLGETAKGLQMVSSSASKVGDYRILTFAKTFVEPLLGQLVRLEQAYETDTAIMALAQSRAQLFQKFGIDEITDEMLREEMTVKVNVGISATDPMSRVTRLTQGLGVLINMLGPRMQMLLNMPEISAEVFNALGYQDGSRFFNADMNGIDPRITALEQENQEIRKALETKAVEEEARNSRMQELQDKKSATQLQLQEMKNENALMKQGMSNVGSKNVAAMNNMAKLHSDAMTMDRSGSYAEDDNE